MPQGTGCCTSLIDAPSTCLALPSLPKVTALQDWARDLSSSHLHMYTLLLARLTQPMSSAQVISPPGRLVLHHLASPGLSCVVHLCTRHLQPFHTVCPLSFHVPWALLGSPSQALSLLVLDGQHHGCLLTQGPGNQSTWIRKQQPTSLRAGWAPGMVPSALPPSLH